MVKICPQCNMKNSNNSDYCINCSSRITGAEIIEEEEFDSTVDEHYKFKPRKLRANIWRPFAILGIFFAIISFFINVMYILTFISVMLGGIALVKGDKLGILAIILGLIPLLFYFNII